MIEQLQNFDFKDILFLVLAILSIVATIYALRISLIQKKPIYDIESSKLFENKLKEISELKTYFNDEEINILTSTKIAFWNGGYQVINATDIAEKDPLMIYCDESNKIFKIDVKYEKNEVNNIRINKVDEHSYLLQFDYLARSEGGIIEILHTGRKNEISLKGTIKGSPKLIRSIVNRTLVIDKYVINPLSDITDYAIKMPIWLLPIQIPLTIIAFIAGLVFVVPRQVFIRICKLFIPKEYIFSIDIN